MADEIDIATDQLHVELDAILANRVVYRGRSAERCEECGEPIPAARRRAIPGCRHCVDCAEELERAAA